MEKTNESAARYYSTATLCEMLDVSRSWLHEQTKAGKFPQPIKLGRLARYPVQAVDRYLAEQEQAQQRTQAQH